MPQRSNIRADQMGLTIVVQWLGLCAPNAGGLGFIPGWGTRSHMHKTEQPNEYLYIFKRADQKD